MGDQRKPAPEKGTDEREGDRRPEKQRKTERPEPGVPATRFG